MKSYLASCGNISQSCLYESLKKMRFIYYIREAARSPLCYTNLDPLHALHLVKRQLYHHCYTKWRESSPFQMKRILVHVILHSLCLFPKELKPWWDKVLVIYSMSFNLFFIYLFTITVFVNAFRVSVIACHAFFSIQIELISFRIDLWIFK
jgi:hypothetical protein